jgi:hypothetical protein
LLQRGGRHLGDLPRSLVRQKEHRSVGLAIDQCQQTCQLTVALEHFQGGNDLQQVLLTANRKNDLSLLATKMILITFAVCASVAAPTSSSGGHTFELADASATGSDLSEQQEEGGARWSYY